MAARIFFSLRVCSTCFNLTTCTTKGNTMTSPGTGKLQGPEIYWLRHTDSPSHLLPSGSPYMPYHRNWFISQPLFIKKAPLMIMQYIRYFLPTFCLLHVLVLISSDTIRLCNWLSLRRLVSWINHLPPACWSTFWKSIFKHQLGYRFDILDSISSFFCILTYRYAIIYVLIHRIIFWLIFTS